MTKQQQQHSLPYREKTSAGAITGIGKPQLQLTNHRRLSVDSSENSEATPGWSNTSYPMLLSFTTKSSTTITQIISEKNSLMLPTKDGGKSTFWNMPEHFFFNLNKIWLQEKLYNQSLTHLRERKNPTLPPSSYPVPSQTETSLQDIGCFPSPHTIPLHYWRSVYCRS